MSTNTHNLKSILDNVLRGSLEEGVINREISSLQAAVRSNSIEYERVRKERSLDNPAFNVLRDEQEEITRREGDIRRQGGQLYERIMSRLKSIAPKGDSILWIDMRDPFRKAVKELGKSGLKDFYCSTLFVPRGLGADVPELVLARKKSFMNDYIVLGNARATDEEVRQVFNGFRRLRELERDRGSIRQEKRYIDDNIRSKEYIDDDLLFEYGASPNSLLTKEGMLRRVIDEDKARVDFLENLTILRDANLHFPNVNLEYSLRTQDGSQVLLFSEGAIYKISGTNKSKPLNVRKSHAISTGVSFALEEQLYEEGTILTDKCQILRGDIATLARQLFDRCTADLILRRDVEYNAEGEMSIRGQKKSRGASGSSKENVRTEGQEYLATISDQVIEGGLFASGGSYKAFGVGNMVFVEFDRDQSATYIFERERFKTVGLLTRKQVRENRAVGYIGRIMHDDKESLERWKGRIDEYVQAQSVSV